MFKASFIALAKARSKARFGAVACAAVLLAAAATLPARAQVAALATAAVGEMPSAQAVSASVAQQLVSRGAAVWDVRAQAEALLPGAVRLDAAAVQRWLAQGDVQALAQAASDAGLNLFGEVLVYGDAGDALAQAVAARLPSLSRGSVFWLVGGVPEWRAHGWATQVQATRRLALPQRLVSLASSAGGAAVVRPAAAAMRSSADAAVQPGLLVASAR